MNSGHGKVGKQYPRPYNFSGIPDDAILVEAAIRRGQPLSTLITPSAPNPQRIALQEWKLAAQYAQDPENPNRSLLLDIYDNIMVDNHLTAIIDNRILKLQQTRFKVTDKVTGKEDEKLTELLQAEWFEDLLKYILESKFYGHSLIELMDIGEDNLLQSITLVPRRHVIQEKGIVVKEVGDEKGQSYLDPAYQPFYLPVGDNKSLGVLYKVSPNLLAKKFALGSWGTYNEKIGIPFRWATTQAVDSDRTRQLGVILSKMGAAGYAVLNEGETIQMLENAKGDPTKCFENLLMYLDNQASKIVLGQDGTTNHSDSKGTYGSLQILKEVADDRHESDKTFAKNVINNRFFPRLALIGYPLEGKWLEWDDSVELGVKDLVAAIKDLGQAGYDVDPDYITDKTGIKVIGRRTSSAPVDEEEETEPTPEEPKKKPTGGRSGKKSPGADARVRLSALYADACKRCMVDIEAGLFTRDLNRLTRELYDGKIKSGDLDPKTVKKLAAYLKKALDTGYGTDGELSDQDTEMIRYLKENSQLFSGFKSYQHLQEASKQLLDENGKVRSFADFKKAVKEIHANYFEQYLKAEYNHAIASAQSASQWVTIQKNKASIPYLRYDTVRDDRVREKHRALEGVTRKVDDTFWQTHYPPNGWGCRCLVSQIQTGEETDLETVDIPKLEDAFNGNVGIDKVIFPGEHPYFDLPANVKKKVTRDTMKIFKEEEDE